MSNSAFDRFNQKIEAGDKIVYSFILNGKSKLGYAEVLDLNNVLMKGAILVKDLDSGLFFNNPNSAGEIPKEHFVNLAIIDKYPY